MKILRKKWLLFLLLVGCQSQPKQNEEIAMFNPSETRPIVTLHTSKGDVSVELFADQAPVTVKNFLSYVDEEFYNKTIFHRVINGFVIQGGGYTSEMKLKTTHESIPNEATAKRSNLRGTLAMARTSDPHSATSQFFINVSDNLFLDHKEPTETGFGYCVFGRVIAGMDVVDVIKAVKTETKKGHQNVPVESITILNISRQK